MVKKLLWGITGSGDKIEEIIDLIIKIQNDFELKLTVILSVSGEFVLKFYHLQSHCLKEPLRHPTIDQSCVFSSILIIYDFRSADQVGIHKHRERALNFFPGTHGR